VALMRWAISLRLSIASSKTDSLLVTSGVYSYALDFLPPTGQGPPGVRPYFGTIILPGQFKHPTESRYTSHPNPSPYPVGGSRRRPYGGRGVEQEGLLALGA